MVKLCHVYMIQILHYKMFLLMYMIQNWDIQIESAFFSSRIMKFAKQVINVKHNAIVAVVQQMWFYEIDCGSPELVMCA